MSGKDIEHAIGALAARFGNQFSTNHEICAAHGRDLSSHKPAPPDAVVFVSSSKDVAAAVKICAAHKVPMIPFGTGTSLEGHLIARQGGVSIDLSAMNTVLEVNQNDLDCRVEAGVTRKQLNVFLRDTGLFFPVDPGADASLGGMCATSASGTTTVRYGAMRENVMGLTMVLPNGEIIKTGGRARKTSAGYDLTRLMIGSEGTLGIITELTLRLYGIPASISAAICSFETLEGAVNAVITTIQLGLPVARIELMDEIQVRACNNYSNLSLPEKPTLLLEFHGSEQSAAENAKQFGEIASEFGGGGFEWATRDEERNRLWAARHDAFFAALELRPGAAGIVTDVCVPISRLAECIMETKADLEAMSLLGPIVGHVGDGNFHVGLLIDKRDKNERVVAERFNEKLIARALDMGGTCTGEHGIGLGKMRSLQKEHPTAVPVMGTIKKALDPHNVMNPGKIFDL